MSASVPPVVVQRLALIGGSSFLDSSALSSFVRREVQTPHGAVLLYAHPHTNADGSSNIYFVQRHAANPDGDKKYSPPHLINYRAIAKALQQLVRAHQRWSSGCNRRWGAEPATHALVASVCPLSATVLRMCRM